FTTSGAWTFPAGTIFVKNFDLVVDERVGAINPIRRVETRILIRYSESGVEKIRGGTYKWRPDNSDADLITGSFYPDELITITQADNTPRAQYWTYPVASQCLICHNPKSGMVLGVKTSQLNGDLTYSATGRTDNQLHTWHHLDMFDQAIADPPTQYARMVDIGDTSATMEDRVKSYQDANCSHCHRPGTSTAGNNGPLYDMRYETPILTPVGVGRIPIVANSGYDGLVRRDIPNSSIHDRDGRAYAPFDNGKMPPLARNVPDQRILTLYDQWVNYAFDVNSATASNLTTVTLQFDRALEPASAATAANYVINNGVTVLQATLGADPSVVTLTTSAMSAGASYLLTVNRVKELAAPQNPIWPNTEKSFSTPAPSVPGAPSITGFQLGNGQVTFSFAPPANDGGSAILSYSVTCTPGPFGTTGASSPLVVSGLSNGTTYSCSARATNSIGTGSPSVPESVTPVAGVPDAPTALTAIAGSGSATLSFTAPNDNGAPITAYTVQCDPGGPGVITGGGSQSPITVSGLTNGTAYACSVAATNSSGTGPYSAPASVTPMLPSLLGVVSRKIHGSTGTFDLPLDPIAALNGPVTVESRGDTNHTIAFRFDMPVSSTGTVATSNGSASAVAVNNEVIVTLTGVADNQRATLSLTNVNGAGVDASVSIGFLVGDVNSTRAINQLDVTAMKARAGQAVDLSNFWFDLNLSGSVTASEVSAVRARVGRDLLP
ncbi:MAG: fibronectin type III domain-containing protein, partial [Betaproteobacteria bacterium]